MHFRHNLLILLYSNSQKNKTKNCAVQAYKKGIDSKRSAIRPFVVGRKNWMFAGSPDRAEASATFFTLIETAKTNGLEPYGYLRYQFSQLPLTTDEQDYRKLLPQNLDPEKISRPHE